MNSWKTQFFPNMDQKRWLYNDIELIFGQLIAKDMYLEIKVFWLLKPSKTAVQGQEGQKFGSFTLKYTLKN